jgi:hypothetical protein
MESSNEHGQGYLHGQPGERDGSERVRNGLDPTGVQTEDEELRPHGRSRYEMHG